MTPYEYFEEMSPLFCTTDVPFDLIGEHMQDHVRRFQLSEKPRRLLVGGMRGRQMLIATPLLIWYLQHGMIVTKIYQVVEFTPHQCFRDFMKEVSDSRRLGDAHPDKAIIADTKKTTRKQCIRWNHHGSGEVPVRVLRPRRGPGHDRGQQTAI